MRREAGFTLLEVLVALVVLGLLVAGLGQGLRLGLDAAARQERLAEERGDMDAVDRVLRRLVVQMDPGTEREPAPFSGSASAASFTTDLGAAASALATSRAEVRLAAEGTRLMLRWQPAIHATRLAPAPPPGEAVLLEGLQRVELSYWGPSGDDPASGNPPSWRPAWDMRVLPLLVRIRLVFPPGTARHWPDIVAGPARAKPGG